MKTRRPISINNSLVHGICNASCNLCAVNKPQYCGPREVQSRPVTEKVIARILEAASQGIQVRYVANAGDGEPTLHPEFEDRMGLFGKMIDEWSAVVPSPEVSVVTNGFRLSRTEVIEPIAKNHLSLIISFPTPDPEGYGTVMLCRPKAGRSLLARVVPGISRAMSLHAQGKLRRLYFHISPPDRDIVRRDFPSTVSFLTAKAREVDLREIELIMFPATSNRTSLVARNNTEVDMYPDLFGLFNGKRTNGVLVRMRHVLSRFFPSSGELVDLVRSCAFPCLWNANLFLAADGTSICCNDQAVRRPQGHIMKHTLRQLMEAKEGFLPHDLCACCDQSPLRMRGTPAASLFSLVATSRYGLSRALSMPLRKATTVEMQT